MPNILIVDDESLVRWALRERLLAAGHSVTEAANGPDALDRFKEGVHLVLLDVRLPGTSGGELLRQLRALDPEPPLIVMTAHAAVEDAVEAMKDGAYYYIRKTADLNEVPLLVERALETTRLAREVRTLLGRERERHGLGNLVGDSDAIANVKALVRRVADRDTTVLLTGESGTGKDLVARALHAESARAGGPFMNITCSALPENLLENELFGHERGSFTDAQRQKKGLLEQASGGTVFLDEIGDIALGAQAKLLRFLEEKAFRRLGGLTDVRPDVRIVAATNRDLGEAVRAGKFREDLLYRLSVVDIALPPLRERTGDVPVLARHFVHRFNRELRTSTTALSAGALEKLQAHSWPGNVRELRNTLERSMILFDAAILEPDQLRIAQPVRDTRPRYELPRDGVDLREVERELVQSALLRTRGNQSRAATLLHITRDQLRNRMAKFHLGDAPDDDAS